MSDAFEIRAVDGFPLGAERYEPSSRARATVLVAGATAVPQGFYRRFAEYANGVGWRVVTFDYRGVGRSAPPSLRGFDADMLTWGTLDLTAAIDAAADLDPNAPLHLVGHSYGGHGFGLADTHHRVRAMYVFGTGAGWHGYMPYAERLRVLALWHLVGPVVTRVKGYLPTSWFGIGEDLPLGVYRDWKHWCGFPRYFFDDPAAASVRARFARVTAPIAAANALDDRWAPPRSRDAFMPGYVASRWIGVDIDPAARGLGEIGHMGYFRRTAQPLWDDALAWLDAAGATSRS